MLKLYNGITSVCSVKARLGLAEMKLDYESIVLDLKAGDQHQADYLQLNPDGVVPTLIDNGQVLVESNLILDHLNRAHFNSALMPGDPHAEARTRLWMHRSLALHDAINSLTYATVNRQAVLAKLSAAQIRQKVLKIPNPVARVKRQDLFDHGLQSVHIEQALLTIRRVLAEITSALQSRPWLADQEFGLADIAIVPFLDRLQRLGFEGFWEQAPEVAKWLLKMQSRPSYARELLHKVPVEAAEKMRQTGAQFWPELKQNWQATN